MIRTLAADLLLVGAAQAAWVQATHFDDGGRFDQIFQVK
jgi:ABC-type sulfate transport system substrate-binding protein